LRLPPLCTFRRFLASLHLGIAWQLLEVQRRVRERVWKAAHVQVAAVRWTPTRRHIPFGNQMGGRKSYNPKNKGKKSYKPILTFRAATREYINLRHGDWPTGAQIAWHMEGVCAALPQVKTIYTRADPPFYCGKAVKTYQIRGLNLVTSVRNTSWWSWKRRTGSRRHAPTPTATRVPLSTRGLGKSLSVHRPALREENLPEEGG
jgi:hypothetical protein